MQQARHDWGDGEALNLCVRCGTRGVPPDAAMRELGWSRDRAVVERLRSEKVIGL